MSAANANPLAAKLKAAPKRMEWICVSCSSSRPRFRAFFPDCEANSRVTSGQSIRCANIRPVLLCSHAISATGVA